MDSWHGLDEDDEGAGAGDDNDEDSFKYRGKDTLIFLVDASLPMHSRNSEACKSEEDGDGCPTPFLKALKCVHSVLRTQIFAAPSSSEIGVLLYGTTKKVGVRDFDHLSVLLPLAPPEGESILKLENLLGDPGDFFDEVYGAPSTHKFALHEALWQCQSMFHEVRGKVASKKVLLMTCCHDPHADDPNLKRQAIKKAGDLQDSGIELDLVAVGGGGPNLDEFDLKAFFIDLLPASIDGSSSEGTAASQSKLDDLMQIVRKRVHKKRASGKVRFDLGGGVELAVACYNLVHKASKPASVRLALDTNETVRRQSNFFHPSTGAPLLPSSLDKFQVYGGRAIRFTKDEVRAIESMDGGEADDNYSSRPGLKLLGFKPLSDLKFWHYVRPSTFVYPEEALVKGSRTLFAALLKKCLHRQVMALCSFRPRERSAPTFVALVPQDEVLGEGGLQAGPPGFALLYLPFSDDLRSVPLNDEEVFLAPERDQVDVARQIVRKLKLKGYTPEAFENPSLQAHYRLIESLALGRSDQEECLDYTLPPLDRMKIKLGDLPSRFQAACKSGSGAKKRKVVTDGDEETGGNKKKAVVSKADPDQINEAMNKHVTEKTVHKLKVEDLKAYLTSAGEAVTAGKKKPDLVQMVYDLFNQSTSDDIF